MDSALLSSTPSPGDPDLTLTSGPGVNPRGSRLASFVQVLTCGLACGGGTSATCPLLGKA